MIISEIQLNNKVVLPDGGGHLLITKTMQRDEEIDSYYVVGITSDGYESRYYTNTPLDDIPVVE